MTILCRGQAMIVIEIAGIRIGFEAGFVISSDEKMGAFENFGGSREMAEECDYIFEVKEGIHPTRPKNTPVYQNAKIQVFEDENTSLRYYRDNYRDWEFCVEEDNTGSRIIVLQQYKRYAENIWNLVNKINLSSLLLKKKALILHASFIIRDGKAILFTGASGIGKSTQAGLWKKFAQAEIINGDRAIIKRNGNGIWAYGIPFSGSSGICKNKEAVVRAIVVLEQAETNIVKKLSVLEAVKYLYSQIAVQRWKKSEITEAVALLEEFAGVVPIVKFACVPEESAVAVLNEYI